MRNRWHSLLFAILVAGAIKATETYVCAWEAGLYSCDLISEVEKRPVIEETVVVHEPELPTEIDEYDY